MTYGVAFAAFGILGLLSVAQHVYWDRRQRRHLESIRQPSCCPVCKGNKHVTFKPCLNCFETGVVQRVTEGRP